MKRSVASSSTSFLSSAGWADGDRHPVVFGELSGLREPGLRVPAEANAGLNGERGFVPISTMAPDDDASLEFADDAPGMVSV